MGKQVLITGENSYIGNSLQKYIQKNYMDWQVDTASVRDDKWREIDYKKYQVIIHLAAVVHQKEQPDMQYLYKKVNTDLPVKLARRSKECGVEQFVFLSTMAVYGDSTPCITEKTKPQPAASYGVWQKLPGKLRAAFRSGFKTSVFSQGRK
ncbi:MAG: NAD-dependent epimerase/dehydratase family protein [Roseburia sp.]|nr:NAD-dependent epimerase/dehydratase family protein [Roseburia sp.]